jgi:hypothetical protein
MGKNKNLYKPKKSSLVLKRRKNQMVTELLIAAFGVGSLMLAFAKYTLQSKRTPKFNN